jgi:hypothetical protein
MTRIERKITFMPNLSEACDRITARAKAENEAKERAAAIAKAKRVIDNPRGYTDSQVREICADFMALEPTREELADGWGVYYQRADQHIFAIDMRRVRSLNEAKCRAALARVEERNDREERARLAMQRKRVGAVTVGVLLALAAIVALRGLGVL